MKNNLIFLFVILPSILFSQNGIVMETIYLHNNNSNIYFNDSSNELIVVSKIYTKKKHDRSILNIKTNNEKLLGKFSFNNEQFINQYFLYSYYSLKNHNYNKNKLDNLIKKDFRIKPLTLKLENKIKFDDFRIVYDFECENTDTFELISLGLNNKFKKKYNLFFSENFNEIFIYKNCELINTENFNIKIESYYYNESKSILIFKVNEIIYVVH